MAYFNPLSMVYLLIAVALGTYVAPQLALVSKLAGRAATISAWCFGASAALLFFQVFVLRFPDAHQLITLTTAGAFGCLVWALWEVLGASEVKS